MTDRKSITRIGQILQDAGLSWLLPNLRQDFVVWNALNDLVFLDKVLLSPPRVAGFHPKDLSPCKLAAAAFDQPGYTWTSTPTTPVATPDPFPRTNCTGRDEQQPGSGAVRELASAGTAALTWLDRYAVTHSWADLVKAIEEHPASDWPTTISCLYGLLDQPDCLLRSLVQSANPPLLVELAVHAILSNPLTDHEQLALFVEICHSPTGDPLPASNRLAVLKACCAQRLALAANFAARWLEVHPADPISDHANSREPAEQVSFLLEDLFQLEIRKLTGAVQGASQWLEASLFLAHELYAGLTNLSLSQLTCQMAGKIIVKEALEPYKQALTLSALASPSHPYTHSRAELAIQLAEKGLFEQAGELLSTSPATLPNDPDLLFAIARVAFLAGDQTRSWQAASKILEMLENHPQAKLIPVQGEGFNLAALGKLLVDLNQPQAAAGVFERALQIDPNEAELLRQYAASCRAAHLDQEATQALAALVALNPGDLQDLRLYSRSLEVLGLWETSLEERAKILASHQAAEPALQLQDAYEYAHCAIQACKPELALEVARGLLEQNPEDHQALTYCGQASLLMGDTEQGMELLSRATQVAPQEPHGWLALAEAYKKTSPLEVVVTTLQQASQAAPASAEIHYALGQALLETGNPTQALPELQAAVELAPHAVQFLVSYGSTLRLLGHAETSCESFARAYQLEPGFPGLAQVYAQLLVDLGKLEQAIAPFETLLQSRSVHDPIINIDYAKCILALHRQGSTLHSPLKALVALNEVLQVSPGLAEAKALTAEALTASGEYELAFQAYCEALDTPLREDQAWFERLSLGLGCVASSLGKQDIAIAALQEASQVNPNNPAIFTALSDAYLAANLPEDALKAARNVVAIDGENPENLAWFASQVARLSGNKRTEIFNAGGVISKEVVTEALSALEKAIQLAPTRTDLLLQLGNFQASLGEQASAQATFASLASLDYATIEDLLSASGYLSTIGDHPAAIVCLERSISLDQAAKVEHDPALYTRLAQEYMESHDPASAIHTLDRALEILPGESSLVSLKVEILLELGQPAEALGAIQAALEMGSGKQGEAVLLLLAAAIHRSMGDFPASLARARQAGALLVPAAGHAGTVSLPVQSRAQLAELYRALLQPEQAYQILQAEPMPEHKHFSSEQDYIDFVLLQVELALETGENIHPDIQKIKLDASHPCFSRLMAINSRLLNKAGNYRQAEQLFQLAYPKIVEHEPPATSLPWSATHTIYLAQVAVIEAAQDLGLWDQALTCARQMAESAPLEPLSHLYLGRGLVLRAEFSHLCEAFGAARHLPALDSAPEELYEAALQHLEEANNAQQAYLGESLISGQPITDAEVRRWQVRAAIAFSQPLPQANEAVEALLHSSRPGDIASAIQLLHQHLASDTDGETLSQMIKLARLFPRNPAVILPLAMALHDSSPQEAVKTLQAVLEHNPYSRNPTIAFCNLLLSRSALDLQEYRIAQEAAEKALSFWPDEPAWHRLAAQAYQPTHAITPLIHHLQEAARLAPKNIDCQLELGKVLLEHANDDASMLAQALDSFEKALELEPENAAVLIHLASTQYALHHLDQAELHALHALSLNPDRADVLQLLSRLAIEKNDFQSAYEYANRATQASPQDAQSTIMLARALSSMGRHQEALAKLNAVIPLVQEAKSLHLERVSILRRVNGPQVALNELKALTSSFPGDFQILEALSKSFYEVGDLENTVAVAQASLAAHEEHASPNEQAGLHLLIGLALRQSGQLDLSIQHLEQAIQLAPNRLEPYLELGQARKERREYQQALQVFERATMIAPNDPRAAFQAGLALKESKDYKSSERMLRRAVSLAPNDLAIRRQLAAVVALNLIHNPRAARINAQ
jgi:Tfp pilus assembly protein PilF